MKSPYRAAAAPPRPAMIYDGDCNFCRVWIGRWQNTTGDRVEYLPFQDTAVSTRFPELPRAECEQAVQLVETDGTIYCGAEAAFRALATNPDARLLLESYQRWPVFARGCDWAYGGVARHRQFFSLLTRLAWGQRVEPPTYFIARWVFLRLLALSYLVAFISLGTQILGLVGARGIVPAGFSLEAARQEMENPKSRGATRPAEPKSGLERFHLVPTLCWLNASDGFLKFQCTAGAVLSAIVLLGIAPAPCLCLLWLIYLSLTTVCREFLGFQWDNLLLETGLLAVFIAPWGIQPAVWRAPRSRVGLWLLRWLLFRLMFASGCVKLLSNDVTWRNLTALNFHYETQPLPTWIGWYAHQLPAWCQKTSTVLMFIIELGVPFLIFAPRRLRHFAACTLIALQVVILATGNYCFFNLLAIALCCLLFDDGAWRGRRWPTVERPGTAIQPSATLDSVAETAARVTRSIRSKIAGVGRLVGRVAVITLGCVIFLVSLMQFVGMFRWATPWPSPLMAIYQWTGPFRSVNSYGLFAVMTTSRPEIIIEGSNDGKTWLEYGFKYKPVDLQRRPAFVAPHQPRLDWQMWFAALGNYRQNPWLVYFGYRLLEGSPDVLALLERNPFADRSPRYIRAVLYDYHFTDPATRRRTGAWWRREPKGIYLPPISLR